MNVLIWILSKLTNKYTIHKFNATAHKGGSRSLPDIIEECKESVTLPNTKIVRMTVNTKEDYNFIYVYVSIVTAVTKAH